MKPAKRTRIGVGLYEDVWPSGKRSYHCHGRVKGRQVKQTLEARNRTEARRAQAELSAKRSRGKAVDPSRRTVEGAAVDFLAGLEDRVRAGERGERTLEAHRYRLTAFVLPEVGRVRLQKLTPDDIAHCIATWREKGYSAWTIRGVLGSLNRLLRFALRRSWIEDNPLSKLEAEEKPRVDRRDVRVLSVDELRRLIDSASPGSRMLIATLAMTGLRQSEALGLVWADLDFETGLIRVRYQLSRKSGERTKPKTKAGSRDVVLIPALAAMLKTHKEAAFQRGHARPESFVFSTASGRPWRHRNASRALDGASGKAGLEGVSTHVLRHGFVSFLILELGFDPVRVAEQVGHARPSITLDTYTHLFRQANHAEAIREKIASSAFGNVLGGVS